MTLRRLLPLFVVAAVAVGGASLASAPAARAVNPIKPICTIAGLVNGLAAKACLLLGQGASGVASTATTALTVAALVTWVIGGAKFLMHETAHVLAKTTAPQLTSTWFSSTYWRVAAIAAVLTLPFLFAAAVQALVRADLSLLIRAALGYLPLALIAVAIAAPLTMLLLAASDQLSAIVSSAAANQSAHFLDRSTGLLGSIGAFVSSSFVGFLVALLTASGAIVLWMELLVREAAVYVIVLMLPLAFAAFVWPARRMWAIRSLELLVGLILSKFAIVAVLSLGGAALAQSANRSVTGLLAGAVLMALAAFAPWAMLRIVPLAELGSAAAASLGAGARTAFSSLQRSDAWAYEAHQWEAETTQMRHTADGVGASDGARASKEGLEANAGGAATSAPAFGDLGEEPAAENSAHRDRGDAPTWSPTASEAAPNGEPVSTAGGARSHDGESTVVAAPGPAVRRNASEPWAAIRERPAFDLTDPPRAIDEGVAEPRLTGEISDPTPPPQPPLDPTGPPPPDPAGPPPPDPAAPPPPTDRAAPPPPTDDPT